MQTREQFEVVIVGAGIAGASLAYFLAERGLTDVLVLERESQPAFHATGRSAAVLVELDPLPTLRRLIAAAAPFLRHPPPGFAEHPLLEPSGIMVLFREPEWTAVQRLAPVLATLGVRAELLGARAAAARVPVLTESQLDGAVLLPEDGHIDVHELLSGYLRHARRRGVSLRCGVEVTGLRVDRGRCTGVVTAAGEIGARWVVDAAGAWAGRVGARAGATPIRLTPCRRTIVTFAAPAECDPRRWPFVEAGPHRLYFGPESDGMLLSPMDEEPMEPGDSHPDELVVAAALERLGALAPRLVPRALRRKWSGLRTFAPDRVPVVGEDPLLPGFFWLAGQGGVGIETSPALGAVAADLIAAGATDRFEARELAPARFARA